MKKATTKDDSGNKTTESWSTYNFQQDTLLPYTHNVAIYMEQQHTIGPDDTRIYLQTRDQFGVGLRDVNVNLYDDGSDLGANFEPLNGQAITDIDGKADIGYIPGGLYTGPTTIDVRVDKSSSFTGSEYCWNSILIDGKTTYTANFGAGAIFQKALQSSHEGRAYQINNPFKVLVARRDNQIGDPELEVPPTYLTCYSHFGAPGGNWIEDGDYDSGCWHWFQTTPEREDGPLPIGSCYWDCISWPKTPSDPPDVDTCQSEGYFPRPSFITQITNFTQLGVPLNYYLGDPLDPNNALSVEAIPLRLPQLWWFWQYYDCSHSGLIKCSSDSNYCCLEEGAPIKYKLFQKGDSEHDLQMSQLNMSKHSYWVDGLHTTDLKTNVSLDQFVFVEDAVPGFWTEKNPRETDIWIRMRPFAFSLNGDTLKFFVRETWTVDDVHYDTGYYDVIERYG